MSSTINSGSSAILETGLEESNAVPAAPTYIAKPVQYIEARWYNDSPTVIKQGELSSDEVGDFVKEKGKFVYTPNPDSAGGFRLLLSMGTTKDSESFGQTIPFSQPDFATIMTGLRIPRHFMTFISNNGSGILAKSSESDGTGLIMQTPDLGLNNPTVKITLMLFHHSASNLTTGLLHAHFGSWHTRLPDLLKQSIPSAPRFHWLHIPIMALSIYQSDLEIVRVGFGSKILRLGGGMAYKDWKAQEESLSGSHDPAVVIKGINRLIHQLACSDNRANYGIRWSLFLLGELKNGPIGGKKPEENEPGQYREYKEYLEAIKELFIGCKETFDSLSKRVTAQHTMLYSTVSQNDNKLNYQIAKAAKSDGYDMKAIALLTTFFLPGTFVATFFSANIIKIGEGVESLWIYWIVTIPLTAVVIASWMLWSKMHRQRDLAADVEAGQYMAILETGRKTGMYQNDIELPAQR